jgi:hypothetical protein
MMAKDLVPARFLDRKAALAQLLGGLKAGILLNEHVAEDGLPSLRTLAGSALRASSQSAVHGTHRSSPCPVMD